MKVTVVGAAKSGFHAALLAKSLGENVFVTESASIEKFQSNAKILYEYDIQTEFGGHSTHSLSGSELVVVSPGVPPTSPIIIEAEKNKLEIISELEYSSRYISNPIISITGTNGKTTTTALVHHILTESGKNAVSGGNIGTPLSAYVKQFHENSLPKDTIFVLESSSYQLDRIRYFRPQVGAILNITPDHLTYHGTFENYKNAKWKTFLNQTPDDMLILNSDDPNSSDARFNAKSQIAYFGATPNSHGAYIKNGNIIFAQQHIEEQFMSVNTLPIVGIHNAYNSMAAALAARAFEIRNENIRDSLMSFRGVEHRLEFVRSVEGVDFINDSKATNINSTWYALSSYNCPLIWIAGGRGDNNDYSSLDQLVREKVVLIIAIGEEQDALFNHFCTSTRCIKSSSLDEAVSKAMSEAVDFPQSKILFSPACKSFDMFLNYEHRGEEFKRIVHEL